MGDIPDGERLALLKEAVESLAGVESVEVDEGAVVVSYDLIQVSLSDIEAEITGEVGSLDDGVADRIRRAMIRYSEECELDNLAHLESHYRP